VGRPADMKSAAVKHVRSEAPHEFAIVDKPEAGRWYMAALRATTGKGFTYRAVAGGENRRLQVFGGAQNENCAGAPVRIWAKAQFGDLLSGL